MKNKNFLKIIYLILVLIVSCRDKSTDINKIPKCSIISPSIGESFSKGSIVEIKFNTSDDDGIIKNIKILIDSSLIVNSDTIIEIYYWDTKNVNNGCHFIRIVVQDDDLAINSSEIHVLIEQDSHTGNSGYFTDSRDCQQYSWVRIGKQIWMSENLNYNADTCYSYNDSLPNSEIYGKLYLWTTACKVCPSGWHLPSDEEWKELEIYLGMDPLQADSSGYRYSDVACKLKSIDTTYWNSPNFCANNESGFTALPAGYRSFVNEINPYHALGNAACFWTSTVGGEAYNGMDGSFVGYDIWKRELIYFSNPIYRGYELEKAALSVRCVKDN